MESKSGLKRAVSVDSDEITMAKDAKRAKTALPDATNVGKDISATNEQNKEPKPNSAAKAQNTLQSKNNNVYAQKDVEAAPEHEVLHIADEHGPSPAGEKHEGKGQFKDNGSDTGNYHLQSDNADSDDENSSSSDSDNESDYVDEPYGTGPVPDRNQSGAWIATALADEEAEAALYQNDDDARFDVYYDEVGIQGMFEDEGILSDSNDGESTADEKRNRRDQLQSLCDGDEADYGYEHGESDDSDLEFYI